MYSYAVRITRSYSDLSGLVAKWAERCEYVAVYEHTGSTTNKVHIHLALQNVDCCSKQLRNLVKGDIRLCGNRDWSFKTWDCHESYCVYMTKGIYDPKYLKKWNEDNAERWKSLWMGKEPEVSYHEALYDECWGSLDQKDYDMELEEYSRQHAAYAKSPVTNEPMYIDKPLTNFEFILWKSRQVALQKAKYLWTNKCAMDYKFLVYTFLFRHNVRIPKEHIEWKKFI